MPVTVGQTLGLQVNDNVSSGQGTFGTAPNAGSLMNVLVASFGNGNAPTVTDNQGNTYVEDVGVSFLGNTNYRVSIFRAYNIATGSPFKITVTGALGSGNYLTWGAVEARNVKTSAALDKTSSAHSSSAGTSQSSGSTGTLSQADEIALCIFGSDATDGSFSATPSGFTELFHDGTGSTDVVAWGGYQVVSATTALNPSWTFSSTGDMAAAIATYEGSGAATGRVKRPDDLSGQGPFFVNPLD
jgi:hypothetical protein